METAFFDEQKEVNPFVHDMQYIGQLLQRYRGGDAQVITARVRTSTQLLDVSGRLSLWYNDIIKLVSD